MSKYFTGNGFLSEEGKRLVEDFNFGLAATFIQDAVKEMSEAELRTLGAALSNIIGNQVSNLIAAKNNLAKKLDDMSDEQFVAFMKAKYGKNWMLISITDEEFNRVKRMDSVSDEQIREAFAQGLEAREAYLKSVPSVNIDPGLRFK